MNDDIFKPDERLRVAYPEVVIIDPPLARQVECAFILDAIRDEFSRVLGSCIPKTMMRAEIDALIAFRTP